MVPKAGIKKTTVYSTQRSSRSSESRVQKIFFEKWVCSPPLFGQTLQRDSKGTKAKWHLSQSIFLLIFLGGSDQILQQFFIIQFQYFNIFSVYQLHLFIFKKITGNLVRSHHFKMSIFSVFHFCRCCSGIRHQTVHSFFSIAFNLGQHARQRYIQGGKGHEPITSLSLWSTSLLRYFGPVRDGAIELEPTWYALTGGARDI